MELAANRNAIFCSAIKVRHTHKWTDRWATDTRILLPHSAM